MTVTTNQKSISVTRALVELKRYDTRIADASSATFVGVAIGRGEKKKVNQGNKTVEQLQSEILASFDKVESLIRNREKLKSAIVMSNAVTYVTLGDRRMTVAEAIELKTSVGQRRILLAALSRQRLEATNKVDALNAELQRKIDQSLNNFYGADNKTKISPDVVASVTEPQLNMNEASMIDPAGIDKKIEALKEQILLVESELDFVLSESNARTMVTVEL